MLLETDCDLDELRLIDNENVLRPPEAAAVPPQHDSRAAL